MKNLRKNLLGVIVATTVVLSSSIAVLAESQTVSPTHAGKSVECTLDVNWYIASNDNADAITKWTGTLSGHTLGVRLYYRDNSSDSWHYMDGTVNPTEAHVSGSRAGVWEFLSEHYVYHVNTSNSITATYGLTSLTDW
jgi:hypothetical protein